MKLVSFLSKNPRSPMSSPIYQAIKQISEEKNIPVESVIETIEAALASAYAKDFGNKKKQNIKINFDPESGDLDVFYVRTVVEDQELPEGYEEELEPADERPQGRHNFDAPPAPPAPVEGVEAIPG